MSSPPPSDRAARGRALLAARARRVARLRRRVVAATLSTFVLAWGMIAWHGSLGAETTATATPQGRRASATAPRGGARGPRPRHPARDRDGRARPDHRPVLMFEHVFWITSRAAGIAA